MEYLLKQVASAKDHVEDLVTIVIFFVQKLGLLRVASVMKKACVVAMNNCIFSEC